MCAGGREREIESWLRLDNDLVKCTKSVSHVQCCLSDLFGICKFVKTESPLLVSACGARDVHKEMGQFNTLF